MPSREDPAPPGRVGRPRATPDRGRCSAPRSRTARRDCRRVPAGGSRGQDCVTAIRPGPIAAATANRTAGGVVGRCARACLRDRSWLATLLRFCLSDSPKDLTGLPLALMADGWLRSFVADPKYPIYAAGADTRALFSGQPHWFLNRDFADGCGLAAPAIPEGLYWMSPKKVLRCLPAILPDGKGLRLNQDGPQSPFPTVGWFTSLYEYLLTAARSGHHWSRDDVLKIPLVPDQTGVLHRPGSPSTPLLGHEEEMEGLGGVLQALGVPLVTAPPELRDAIAAFAATVPNFLWKLTGPDLVDTLGSLDSDSFPDFDAEVHPRLLDYLAPTVDGRGLSCQGRAYPRVPGAAHLPDDRRSSGRS